VNIVGIEGKEWVSVCGGVWVTPKSLRSEGLSQTKRRNRIWGNEKSI